MQALIVFMILAGSLHTVTPPQKAAAPDMPGEVAQMMAGERSEVPLLYAHNYLDGGEFYDLEVGSSVLIERTDGSIQKYKVDQVLKTWAQSTDIASGGSNMLLESAEGREMHITEWISELGRPEGSVVLVTCYAARSVSGEFGPSTGRLFIRLIPVESFPVEMIHRTISFRGI